MSNPTLPPLRGHGIPPGWRVLTGDEMPVRGSDWYRSNDHPSREWQVVGRLSGLYGLSNYCAGYWADGGKWCRNFGFQHGWTIIRWDPSYVKPEPEWINAYE